MINLDKIRKLLQGELDKGTTRRDLGKKIGIPPASIYNYLYTSTQPSIKVIEKLSLYFGIAPETLLTDGVDLIRKSIEEIPDDYRKADIYSMAGVGRPNQLTETDPIDTIFLRKDFINEHIHVVVAKGDSMQPTIMDGAYVGVDIEDKEIVSGRVYALHFPYEGNVIKRITTGIDGIYVISDNADKVKYPTQKVLPHDVGDHFILGRVKWVIQKF